MMRFKKGYNFRIIRVVISIAFLFIATRHSYSFSEETLRVPSFFQTHRGRIESALQFEKYPVIYHLDIRLLHKRFSEITEEELLKLKSIGASVLWLVGVYEESPYSKMYCKYYAVKEGRDKNVEASNYSIWDYKIKESLGGEIEFKNFVLRANKVGLRIMLDFVPNHMAIDSPLFFQQPELFMRPFPGLIEKEGGAFERTPERITAVFKDTTSGKVFCFGGGRRMDNHKRFPAWGDTVQFDITNPKTREYLKQVIFRLAELTNGGGFRFDAVHHLERREFRETWFPHLSDEEFERLYPEKDEFLRNLLLELRDRYPVIVLVGEYFGSEADDMLDMGFDFISEERFRELLVKKDVRGLKSFLRDISSQQKFGFLKQLENHDYFDRIISLLGEDASLAAAALLYTLPGASLVLAGQERGYSLWVPSASYINGPQEKDDPAFVDFYHRLGKITSSSVFRNGNFNLLPFNENPDNANVLLFERSFLGQKAIVAVNYGESSVTFEAGILDKTIKLNLPPWGLEIFELRDNNIVSILQQIGHSSTSLVKLISTQRAANDKVSSGL